MNADACPGDEQLAAHLEGYLDAEERSSIADHIDRCDHCRAVMIAAVQVVDPGGAGAATLAEGSDVDHTRAGGRAVRGDAGELAIGSSLGRYRLVELLGSGAMGRVYRARDLGLDRDVALKVLRPELARGAEVLTERLLRESRLMARVSHPSVITVHDVGREGGLVFVAMELIRGCTLAAWLRERPRRVDDVLATFAIAGRGLAAAHRAGLIHRDFKPDNVLVELDGGAVSRVVVTDFGVARAIAEDGGQPGPDERHEPDDRPQLARGSLAPEPSRAALSLTATGAAIGTPAYMAPEQLHGQPIDQRADVFSFAVSLWEALWGARPYPGRSIGGILEAMERPPVRPRTITRRRSRPGGDAAMASGAQTDADAEPVEVGPAAVGRVPRAVAAALERALRVDPRERTASVDAVVRIVDPAARRRRRRLIALAAGAAAVAVAASLALVIARGDPPIDPCAAADAPVRELLSAPRLSALVAGTAAVDRAGGVVRHVLGRAQAWQAAHGKTCVAGVQDTAVAACLAARRTELTGVAEDVVDPQLRAIAADYVGLIGDPAACAQPASGLLSSRIPTRPELRASVRRIRVKMFEAEQLRDRGEMAAALALIETARREAEPVWAPLHAETLYVQGATQLIGGDSSVAAATLQQAAALGERAHNDHVAASAWIQLASAATSDELGAARALEYISYADAALDRIGRPDEDEVLFLYHKAAALMEAKRVGEAEPVFEQARQIAARAAPHWLPTIEQGLAFLYDLRGEFRRSVAVYREALDHKVLASEPGTEALRAQMALGMVLIGDGEAALREADRALAEAQGAVDERNSDWLVIEHARAVVLRMLGRPAEALAAVEVAQRRTIAIAGKRSGKYGVDLQIMGLVLGDLGRLAEAEAAISQGCENIAFYDETSVDYAGCLGDLSAIELRLRKPAAAYQHARESIALVDKLIKDRGDVTPVLVTLGEAAAALGRHDEAIAALDRAIAVSERAALHPGFLASAQLAKARVVARRDRAAAVGLAEAAVAALRARPDMWARELREAEAWLAAARRER